MRILLIAVLLCAVGCGYIGDASRTVFNETKASSILRKYEWCKDAAAQLDSLSSSIKVQEKRLKWLEAERDKWNRDDRQNWHQMTAEIAGIKAAYNNLAAEYNSAMSKVNYRFANDLPRDFSTYKDE
jgi:hypothetical protein